MLKLGDEWISVSAPATIANVGPGFDVLGIAVKNIEDVGYEREPTFLGDIVHIRRSKGKKPLIIREIYADGKRDNSLTTNVDENVVGIAALNVFSNTEYAEPLEIILEKMPFKGSGMGSSAASVVAGAYAALIMSRKWSKTEIAETVVKCEVGSHPDNVLPALFGGIVASYGLTDDQSRLENLYNFNIVALKEAICSIKGPSFDSVLERLKAIDNDSINKILQEFEQGRKNIMNDDLARNQAKQHYQNLLKALETKKLKHDQEIEAAINELKKYESSDLLEGICHLRESGIGSIETDLKRAETHLKRAGRRRERKYLGGLLANELRQMLEESAPSTIELDYRRLNIPEAMYDALYFVLIKPDVSISTVEARNLINRTPALGDVVANSRSLTKLITCLYEGDIGRFGDAVCQDRIVEPARAPLIPGYYGVKAKALELGAYGFNISGSGPTCFAVSDNINTARIIANGCMEEFDRAGSKSSAYICKVDMEGAKKVLINKTSSDLK